MPIDFLYPDYEVVRNNDRCIRCRGCERQCANEVHSYFEMCIRDSLYFTQTKAGNTNTQNTKDI